MEQVGRKKLDNYKNVLKEIIFHVRMLTMSLCLTVYHIQVLTDVVFNKYPL